MNKEEKKALAIYTNPFIYPVLLGMAVSAVLKAVFGDVAKRTKHNFELLAEDDDNDSKYGDYY